MDAVRDKKGNVLSQSRKAGGIGDGSVRAIWSSDIQVGNRRWRKACWNKEGYVTGVNWAALTVKEYPSPTHVSHRSVVQTHPRTSSLKSLSDTRPTPLVVQAGKWRQPCWLYIYQT